jgi:hypothetical protein
MLDLFIFGYKYHEVLNFRLLLNDLLLNHSKKDTFPEKHINSGVNGVFRN